MNNDQSKIEELKKKLYSVSSDAKQPYRLDLHRHAHQVERTWENENESLTPPTVLMKKRYGEQKDRSVLKKLLIFSFFALISAGVFAWYMFASGSNYVSANNIDIRIIGPVAIPAGETLTLDVDVINTNPEKIETVDLIIEYPEGTRRAEDGLTTLLSDRLPIGNIAKSETVRRKIQVLLFGEENVKKEIKIIVEYKVPGSVILFRKEKKYPIYIGSAPVSIDISNFKEVIPNQITTFKVVVNSNSKSVIKNLVFKAEYPAGFIFDNAIPAASFNTDTWSLGDMAPGDIREIEITGKIIGDANIERYFGFVTGTEDPLDKSNIAIRLVENKEKILVQKPFLSADVFVGKSGSSVYAYEAGTPIRAEVVWQNNLNVPIYDLILEMQLSGSTIDKKTVESEQGFYQSQNNLILWDKSLVKEFIEIAPGQSGSLQFSLSSLPSNLTNNSTLRRQNIKLDLTVRAKRLSEDRVPQEIKSTATKSIKIASELTLASRLVHSIGPFENTGPVPMEAERATTYTVINSISNSFNNVKDVIYKVTLPTYVNWTGNIFPANSNAKYNVDTKEITWSLGDISPGVGYNTGAREFSYQVTITPSISQVGQTPNILSNQSVLGTDAFAETVIQSIVPPLGTSIETDPMYRTGIGRVID